MYVFSSIVASFASRPLDREPARRAGPDPMRSESIIANVGMSEGGPPGEVSLDRGADDTRSRRCPRRRSRASGAVHIRRDTLAATQSGKCAAPMPRPLPRGWSNPLRSGGAHPRVVSSNAGARQWADCRTRDVDRPPGTWDAGPRPRRGPQYHGDDVRLQCPPPLREAGPQLEDEPQRKSRVRRHHDR